MVAHFEMMYFKSMITTLSMTADRNNYVSIYTLSICLKMGYNAAEKQNKGAFYILTWKDCQDTYNVI